MSNALKQNTYLRQPAKKSRRGGGEAQRKARIGEGGKERGDGEGDPAGGKASTTVHQHGKRQKEREIFRMCHSQM